MEGIAEYVKKFHTIYLYIFIKRVEYKLIIESNITIYDIFYRH